MITTYIPESLIRELKADFPDRLPTYNDYFNFETVPVVTPEQIAFKAGIQHIIRHLEAVAETQRRGGETEDIEILI